MEGLQKFFVYIISLKGDSERRNHMINLMERLGLDYNFFDAVESSDITEDDENGFFKSVDYHNYNVNVKSVMATFKSHIELIRKSAESNINILILEDDADMVKEFDFDSVDFKSFDVYNIGADRIKSIDCHSYFVSAQGAKKVIDHIDSTTITQAFDWEMIKIPNIIHIFEPDPFFVQRKDLFISYNAPNGY